MANIDRAEKINHWLEMGPEKMAAQMWTLYTQRNQYKDNLMRTWAGNEKEISKYRAEREMYDGLLMQNERMAEVLQENGIRPKQLEIKYITQNCEKCPCYDSMEEACTSECYGDDGCEFKEVTVTIGFYVFEIDDGVINGITSKFDRQEFNAVEIRDAKTGRILYRYSDEEDN